MGDILLARWAGMNVNELDDTPPVWVARLKELYYQSHKQGVSLWPAEH